MEGLKIKHDSLLKIKYQRNIKRIFYIPEVIRYYATIKPLP